MPLERDYKYEAVAEEARECTLRKTWRGRCGGATRTGSWTSYTVIAFVWIVTLLLTYQFALWRTGDSVHLCAQLTYSPAQEAVEYEIRVFSQGSPDEHTEYYGPPNENNNRLWRELWSVGGGQGISRTQASRLTNRTSRLPPLWPDLYYIDIDVFHQLHCLDHIRHALANDTQFLHSAALLGDDHVYHCFDAVRESLMCHGDISTIVQQWSPMKQREVIRGDVPHTCRNFWKLHAWAREHAIGNEWDTKHDYVDYDLRIDEFN